MTIDEATEQAFHRYRDLLINKGYSAENHSAEAHWEKLSKRDQLAHALWMCDAILSFENRHYSVDKKSRWLGFVQATLIINGLTSIESERNITRPWFTGKA